MEPAGVSPNGTNAKSRRGIYAIGCRDGRTEQRKEGKIMSRKLLFATMASMLMFDANASTVLTSQTYVDGVAAEKVDIAQGVGTNNANVGKTLVVNSSGNLELGTIAAGNFIEDSITDGVTNKAPSENAVHDALADKQNTITTGLVEFNDDPDFMLPAIVTYDSTDGVTGNKIGILDQETIADDEGYLSLYSYNGGGYGAEMDNYVPTVRAVAEELNNIWNSIPSTSNLQTKIPATGTSTFDNGGSIVTTTGTNGVVGEKFIWTASDGDMTDWEELWNGAWNSVSESAIRHSIPDVNAVDAGLRTRQTKIPASGYNDYWGNDHYNNNSPDNNSLSWLSPTVKGTGLVTKTSSAGMVGERKIFEAADVANYGTGTTTENQIQDISIPTVGAMMAAIANSVVSLPTGTAGNVVTYNSNGAIGGSVATYDGSTTYNASTDAGKIATAAAVETKQTQIPAGTAGNIVTYTGTAGSVGSVATAGAPTYDNSGELTNDTSIPTMGAVVNQRAHFGTSTTAKATATKEVSIPDLTALNEGLILVITPTITSTAGDSSLQVTGANNVVLGTHQMKYHNVALTDTTDGYVWVANTPALWIFHDNAWHFIAYGKYDSNTTYAAMSVAEGIAGTAENARSMYASRLKEIIQGTTLTGLDTTDATTVVATDSITTGIGKLQAQITDVAGDVPTLPTGTSGNVVTYNSNGAIGGSVATYDGSTTYNASTDAGKIATAAAVDTKQNKMTCTRWFDNTEHTDANCLLWSIAN